MSAQCVATVQPREVEENDHLARKLIEAIASLVPRAASRAAHLASKIGPLRPVVRSISRFGNPPAVGTKYDAEKYWSERHRRYRHSFRGVGNISRDEIENINEYIAAVATIAHLFRLVEFDPRGKSALDVGCGNGFWTGIFRKLEVSAYTGLDITDAMFDLLRRRYPDSEFLAGRVQRISAPRLFQLIALIDVTQHIIDDVELRDTLRHLRSLLDENGVLIITFWDQVRPPEDMHEAFRTFSFYTDVFVGMSYTEPLHFRDKFISAFYNPQRQLDVAIIPELTRESIMTIVSQITTN